MKTSVSMLAWALSRVWALHPDYVQRGYALLLRHAQGERASAEEVAALAAAKAGKSNGAEAGYTVNSQGVAVVPVSGVIAKRMADVNGWCAPQGTSVEALRQNIDAALADKEVKAIVLDVDSPGGTVDGVADLSQYLFSVRGQKPITAFANGLMASAAYYIGSAADKIVASQDAEVGSIGVYSILEDDSEAYKAQGVRFEMIKAGKFKGEGHPLFPITQEARTLTQETVDAYYSQFVSAVARNRGIALDKALSLANGKTEIGAKAQALGLVDEIGTLDTAMQVALSTAASKPQAASNFSFTQPRGCMVQVERSSAMEREKTNGPEASASGNAVKLDSLTFNEFKSAAPNLFATVRAEVLREESARKAAIFDAIKATGLDASVQGSLIVVSENMSVESARAEISRVCQIEAVLAGAKVAGLSDEDLTALRADAHKLPVASATQLVKSFTDAKKGVQGRMVNTPDQASTGKDPEKKPESEKFATAIKTARADFANVAVVGVTEAAYVSQCLDMAGLKASDADMKAAAPDLFK